LFCLFLRLYFLGIAHFFRLYSRLIFYFPALYVFLSLVSLYLPFPLNSKVFKLYSLVYIFQSLSSLLQSSLMNSTWLPGASDRKLSPLNSFALKDCSLHCSSFNHTSILKKLVQVKLGNCGTAAMSLLFLTQASPISFASSESAESGEL
jgi:hypothetical protein